jgi:hypothetical protein
VSITQITFRLKGIAVGAALAALVAMPLLGQGAGTGSVRDGAVTVQRPAATRGGCPDPKNCTDPALASGRVSQQDFHFVMYAPDAPRVETALNFPKIKYEYTALNFTKIAV